MSYNAAILSVFSIEKSRSHLQVNWFSTPACPYSVYPIMHSPTKCLGILYKGSGSCLQPNASSFFLFQIHEFKDTAQNKSFHKHTSTGKHKFNIMLSFTHAHAQYCNKYTSENRSELFWQQSAVSYWTVCRLWQASGAATTTSLVNTTWPWTIHIII